MDPLPEYICLNTLKPDDVIQCPRECGYRILYKKRTRRRPVGADRISELPEGVLHHVQSFLSMKEAMRNSVLSKTWKQISVAPPNLEFDESFFPDSLWDRLERPNDDFVYEFFAIEKTKEKEEEEQKARIEINQLFDIIDQIISPFSMHKLSVNKFTIELQLVELDWAYRIDQWIQHVVASNVKEVSIDIRPFERHYPSINKANLNEVYNVPHCIFLAKSIVTLEIEYCKIELPFETNLSSLKKLSLHGAYLNDDALHNIIVGCGHMEDLNINRCEGFKTLHIPDHLVKLKRVSAIAPSNRDVYIYTKLAFICIEAPNVVNVDLCDVSLDKLDMRGCQNLKNIDIQWSAITELKHINFPILEKLTLHKCRELETLKIEGHRLKRLNIASCPSLARIELDTPNLSQFRYVGDAVEFSSNIPPTSLVYLAINNKRFISDESGDNIIELSWYRKFITFLANFNNQCEELCLYSYKHKNFIFPNELRQSLPPPLNDLKKLNVKILTRKEIPLNGQQLINSISWMSPHLENEIVSFDEKKRTTSSRSTR